MNLRFLTAEGLEVTHTVLDQMKAGELSEVPSELLHDDQLAVDTGKQLLRFSPVASRFELALWLNKAIAPETVAGFDEIGIWTWLTLTLFDTVAPKRADGTRKINDRALYVLEPDSYRRYYRHLLAGPWNVARAHWDEVHITRAILAGKPSVPGELYEQIASRQELVTSRAVVQLTKTLYWSQTDAGLKRGAGGSGGGSPRRLATLMEQLDRTWDVGGMEATSLVPLLPAREYARFLASP